MLYPLTFHPIFKERIWGGRNIERLYGKTRPAIVPIGESWEISDRPGDESVISNGPLSGKNLRSLMEDFGESLLGKAKTAASGRFPLLIKILDAQEKLSLQVHPPASKAAELGGEPKTEMWFIADATPDADLFVGLRRGATRAEFERRLQDGSVAECFHRIPVKRGDTMFLPSGRVHAIGAGNVIYEIQQNSDTTYRVFDWNRVDNKGKPRELHIQQSLASIDFNDFEPPLAQSEWKNESGLRVRSLVNDPLFSVELCEATGGAQVNYSAGKMEIFGVLSGKMKVEHAVDSPLLSPGDFCLVPASENATLKFESAISFLRVRAG